jgi:hypothetical protein
MSTVRVLNTQSAIRLTPEGESSSTIVVRSAESVIKLSQVGVQGAKGDQGDPGTPGQDGEAGIPEIMDGGNF